MASRVSLAVGAAFVALGSAGNPSLRGQAEVPEETSANASFVPGNGSISTLHPLHPEVGVNAADEAWAGDVQASLNTTEGDVQALWGGWPTLGWPTNSGNNFGWGNQGSAGNTYASQGHGQSNGNSGSHHSGSSHAGGGGGGSCGGSDKVVDASKTCAANENYHCGGCYIYRQCKGRHTCVLNGYMIAPGAPLRGMEDINAGDAGKWDFLWTAARAQCGSDSCVLISNPIHFRTQHQMHLHYRHYNGGGAALKSQLESTLCGTSGWQPFNECGAAKARLFDSFPGVFAVVDAAYGGGNLANVGITVWFTNKCGGGQKIMVLAQTGCSIEHSISAR